MNTKMQTKKTKRGFTITELVIVIAVIAILAAVLIPTFSNVIQRANESAAMQEAKSEWDNFSPEVTLGTDENQEGNNFLFIYTNGDRVMNFAVINGQFEADPVTLTTDDPQTFTANGYTYTKSTGVGTKVASGAYASYEVQNEHITIFVLIEAEA